ncbi:MAG TPA: nucleotidyl transferase AbiEii/AbiGii toxin family protein [Cyclobacteriaceae bacterium]|nr:nucleotidyl transferase AbiEii/AbiGii toxin family protein [Cyclobacteriaceae bacterium]
MKDWIHHKELDRIDSLRLVAGKINLPDFMIEKDWWVTAVLEGIFTSELPKAFAFKGGTSLSKAWNLLNRFSEDIDIVISKSLFGTSDDEPLNRSQRERLRDKAHKFIREEVVPILRKRLLEIGIPEKLFKIYPDTYVSSDQDPTVIFLDYTSLTDIPDEYTKHQIKIEIGVRAMMVVSLRLSISLCISFSIFASLFFSFLKMLGLISFVSFVTVLVSSS